MKITFPSFPVLSLLLYLSCSQENPVDQAPEKLFSLRSPAATGVTFTNTFEETNSFNFLNYAYIYNGGGVAIADFNQDGLQDLYFTANQGTNKLYLNHGNFKFQDITESAGVADEQGWTTGVAILDVNVDGYPDIYVCKSGSPRKAALRKNKLYINQQDGTFQEAARQWDLDHYGFSTQAYPLDYDKDGDLDLYLVNHRPDFGNNSIDPEQEADIWNFASDQLFRNEGEQFTNVTTTSGIANKAWGLSASIGDFNEDGWPDIYVCNDFNQPDYLYINNQQGQFYDSLQNYTRHISMNSMGSDLADFNNDELADLMVLDMSAEDHVRSKSNMPSMSTEQFYELVNAGYHHQYMNNVLQLNQREGFSDVAQMAHVAKTDWSWAPLFVDLDQDGWKDLLVTNGIFKDLGNVDFRNSLQNKIQRKDAMSLETVLDMVPSTKLPNYAFKNNQDLTFINHTETWGLDIPTFSNGMAFGDLDNDGDQDLVINNIDDPAHLYENHSNGNYLQLELIGAPNNPMGLGAQITIRSGGMVQRADMQVARGFQSSVSPVISFGIGQFDQVDQLTILWSDGSAQELTDVKGNQRIPLKYQEAQHKKKEIATPKFPIEKINPTSIGLTFRHQENEFDDYSKQLLLPWKMSKMGPFITTGDINGDQMKDLFIGGAAGQAGEIYLQTDAGFQKTSQQFLQQDRAHEDMQALFFDFDGDQDQDLYVVSGGNAFPEGDERYQDRLYENDGKGNFIKTNQQLPQLNSSGQVVSAADVDADGDPDLFTGGRLTPWKYPYTPASALLINEEGVFHDRTKELAPVLESIGMVTGAVFSDFDLDGDQDLILVGEWMSVQFLTNNGGKFRPLVVPNLQKTTGLWQSIQAFDIDHDGDDDYFLGNLGTNTKYKVDKAHRLHIYCDDFDQSGSYDIVLSNSYQDKLVPVRGRECSSQQVPFIQQKFQTYEAFANASVVDVFGAPALEQALHIEADLTESVFIKNNGDGFSLEPLPNELQISPIQAFEFVDINGDGQEEIISVGNHYDTEVETTRFDASHGNIMKWNNPAFEVIHASNSDFHVYVNAKDLKKIRTSQGQILLVTENDGPLMAFKIN